MIYEVVVVLVVLRSRDQVVVSQSVTDYLSPVSLPRDSAQDRPHNVPH